MATKTKATQKTAAPINSPGTLVLQWLTYAFWGWFTVALTWLTAVSVSYFVTDSSDSYDGSDIIAYSLAAVIVLYIIALVCDLLYSRREPLRKQGASTVIMLVHAVIFALFGIAALIAAVFAVVNMLVNPGDGNGARVTFITGIVIAVVFAATLLRTLRPLKLKRVTLLFASFMALVAMVITVLAISGPTMNAVRTQDDRLIERLLPNLTAGIREYARENDKLPVTLQDIRDDVRSETRELIDRDLVEYAPGKEVSQSRAVESDDALDPRKSFDYRICVSYKESKNNDYDYGYEPGVSYRDVTPNTYSHGAGRVCYDLVTNIIYDR